MTNPTESTTAQPTVRLVEHLRTLGYAGRAARDLLETGKVLYDGIPTGDSGRAVEPACVEVRMAAPRLVPNRDVAVIYRDQHLAVVFKPPGMLAVETVGRHHEPNVVGFVRKLFGAAYVVHRLDEPTSGLMMVALTESCQRQIKAILFRHDVTRVYWAIVRGQFPATAMTVTSKLVRNRGDGLRGSDDDADDGNAKEATTHLRLLEPLGPHASLVEARLETGRTHQVRIHLSERGFPILGDRLYGSPGVGRAASRLALHAAELGFEHPVTHEKLSFKAALADDLEQMKRRLCHQEGPPGAVAHPTKPQRSKRRRH